MARDENLLKRALELVKPELKAELEKNMKELAAKWDSLSEDQHEDYYWGDGTIGFVFEDNKDLWKDFQGIDNSAINPDDGDELGDCILDYICPFEGSEDEGEDASDEDAFSQSFEISNNPRIIITLDPSTSENAISLLTDEIKDVLDFKGTKYSIDREN